MQQGLFTSVRNWFNQSHEIELRIQELSEGLTEEERKLLRHLPPHSTVLDIGCAAGRTAIALAGEGHTVTGIDVAENLIEQAKQAAEKQAGDVTFQVCDPVNLPFEEGSFDAVLLLKTYCYVPGKQNRIAWLDEIGRVVKPEGRVFVSQYIIDDVLGGYEPIEEENRERFPDTCETLEEGDGFSLPKEGRTGYVHYFMAQDLLDELISSRFEIADTFRVDTICYCSLMAQR